MSNCVQHIQPKKDCPECQGCGFIPDEIDDGERRYRFQNFCDCVTEQVTANDVIVIVIVVPQDEDVDFDDFKDYDPILSKEEETLLAIDLSSETLEEWQAKEDAYFAKYVRTP
jgi:hypothetical protein